MIYQPLKKAKLGIISLNLKVIKSLLNQLTRPKELAKSKSTPIISLLVYVINLILILCSYKLIFLWLMALYLLIKLVTFPAKLMIQTLKKIRAVAVDVANFNWTKYFYGTS